MVKPHDATTEAAAMRRSYHLPTDIELSGEVPAAYREQLTALVRAAIDQAVRGVAAGETVQPATGTRPLPRARVAPPGRDVYVIPSYGGDKQVGIPVVTKPAAAVGDDHSFPAPLPSADVPYPPDHPDTALTGADSPALVTYLRNSPNLHHHLPTNHAAAMGAAPSRHRLPASVHVNTTRAGRVLV